MIYRVQYRHGNRFVIIQGILFWYVISLDTTPVTFSLWRIYLLDERERERVRWRMSLNKNNTANTSWTAEDKPLIAERWHNNK